MLDIKDTLLIEMLADDLCQLDKVRLVAGKKVIDANIVGLGTVIKHQQSTTFKGRCSKHLDPGV